MPTSNEQKQPLRACQIAWNSFLHGNGKDPSPRSPCTLLVYIQSDTSGLSRGKDTIMTLATLVLADVNLSLPNVLWWLVVGLVAGFLASRIMRGGGYGLIGDIVVGLIGAFIGGWLAGLLGIGGSSSLVVSILIAFIGACLLLAVLHAVNRGGASRSRGWGRR